MEQRIAAAVAAFLASNPHDLPVVWVMGPPGYVTGRRPTVCESPERIMGEVKTYLPEYRPEELTVEVRRGARVAAHPCRPGEHTLY